jgi:SAM-dependent methyltransferase
MPSIDRFEQAYSSGRAEDLPWYNAEPDADVVRWFDKVLPKPSDVVDLGAGPAVHGIALAQRGHRVTAVDGVSKARDLALNIAKERGVTLDYRVANALDWEPAREHGYDLVFDRGFLHTIEPEERPRWLKQVRRLLRKGGHAVIKEFTSVQRGFGPPGLSAKEMLAAIDEGGEQGLHLVALERSSFNLSDQRDDLGPHSAWTLVAERR